MLIASAAVPQIAREFLPNTMTFARRFTGRRPRQIERHARKAKEVRRHLPRPSVARAPETPALRGDDATVHVPRVVGGLDDAHLDAEGRPLLLLLLGSGAQPRSARPCHARSRPRCCATLRARATLRVNRASTTSLSRDGRACSCSLAARVGSQQGGPNRGRYGAAWKSTYHPERGLRYGLSVSMNERVAD